jgi:hypothetical protein
MKMLKILFTTIIILSSFLISSSFQIPMCKASTHVFDYDQDVYDEFGNDLLFSFEIKIIIETERDGTWRISQPTKNYSYMIKFAIMLTYINTSRFPNPDTHPTTFLVEFGRPDVGFANISPKRGFEEPWGSRSSVWGLRGVAYTDLGVRVTTPYTEGKLALTPSCNYKQYYGGFEGPVLSTDGLWVRGPIYIDVTEDTQKKIITELENIRNLLIILITTTIALIAITIYRERKLRIMNTGRATPSTI